MSLEVEMSLEELMERKLNKFWRSRHRDILEDINRLNEILDWYFGARLRRDCIKLQQKEPVTE